MPAVTGRSSFLNEVGEAEQVMGCTLDPNFRIAMEDWIPLMANTQYYEWMGEGVLATLTVGLSSDVRGITYKIWLDFEDFSMKQRREGALALYQSAQDGANARKIAAQRAIDLIEAKRKIKLLEENAVRRGDSLISR